MFERNTKQRSVILEELRKVKSHPTAQQLHEIVKKRLPNISLATVYRNLDQLALQDQVRKLETAGSEKRFDSDISDHIHIRCSSCGCIEDLKIRPDQVIKHVKIVSDWKVIGGQIEYKGICPNCHQQQSA